MTPGWGDSRLGMLARIDAFAPECSRVVAWDPPGHGEAPGRWTMGVREPSMLLEIADTMHESTGRRCVLFGSSAGGGVSVVSAAMDAAKGERAVAGVIAEAPYRFPQVPARNVIRQAGYPWAINGPIAFALMGVIEGVGTKWRGFDRAAHASNVRAPVLVIHGSEDAVCPLEDGRAIAESAGGELVVIEGAGHNDLWTEPPARTECVDAVRRFLRSNAGG
jgi:pimeloyl-ACP methyl ester carboxylesterase